MMYMKEKFEQNIMGGDHVKRVYLTINQEKTAQRISSLIREHGYTARDIQQMMGFGSPQAIYKWTSGRSLPSLDNLLVLSRILHTDMESILVIDEDAPFAA